MSNFQKLVNGIPTGTTIQGTDISSGSATSSQFLAANGSAGSTYRSILVSDIPTLNQDTTGTAANITGTSNSTLTTLSALVAASSLSMVGTITSGIWNGTTIAIANGGTDNGSLAVTAGGVLYTDGTKFQNTGAGSSGQVLLSGGSGTPTWGSALTNPMTTLGDIIYENSSPAPARLAGNTTSTINFLSQTGTGSVSAAPVWAQFIAPTVQIFNSGTLQTYTLPTSPRKPVYIRVRMVGGGAGGSGSGTSAGNSSTGNSTIFGSLLTASGGSAGTFGGSGGVGGSASIGSGSPQPIGISISGGGGGAGADANGATTYTSGGIGGSSAFGGGGFSSGGAGAINSGGGGAGAAATTTGSPGVGGGSGGFIDVIIPSPNSTYTYTVAASVSGGTAGSGGSVGGAGGSGVIIVEEYYQ